MNEQTSWIISKEKSLNEFIAFHQARLPEPATVCPLKLFFCEMPNDWAAQQHSLFLINNDMYREDHGTFYILLTFLRQHYSTSNIDEADFIVLPFNLEFYAHLTSERKAELDRIAVSIKQQSGDRPMILFSIGDFCMKPGRRSTLLEKYLFQQAAEGETYTPAWIEPKDIFICFESTIDLIFHDIPVFPLIPSDPVDTPVHSRDLLYSFIGEYSKEGWPEGFIRSPSNNKAWQVLANGAGKDALVLNTEEAKKQDQYENPFYEIPRKSVFTLCPRGITSWSFRVYEAILNGSIPVIISDAASGHFSDEIPWDQFSIRYPERYLPGIDNFLRHIQPEVIHALTINVRANQHHFTAAGLTALLVKRLQKKAKNNNTRFKKYLN